MREAVAGLLAKRSDSAAVRRAIASDVGYDTELWQVLCEQIGVAALAIPERWGGADASPVEAHVVFEELGRTLTPSPLLGIYLCAQLLLALGDSDACARLLPRIAAGEVVALAWADESGWHDGAVTFADGTLSGTAHYVLDGDQAQALLVVTPSGVVEVDDPAGLGVTRVHTPTMDPTRRLARITFDGASGSLVGTLSDAARGPLETARDRV
ncbi:MAG TPA: acyl-CoA dehydrogenase family protein, partial [Solirubrobacteraceae bacterium]